MSFKIAIDGPSASGKTEVSKRLANVLGICAVDSGAIYRAVALYCLINNIDVNDENKVIQNLKNIEVELDEDTVVLNGKDVSQDIRKNEVSLATSKVATFRAVREFVTKVQRKVAGSQDVVMQGRDIASVVLPDADLKIYLNAKPEVRATRRMKELEEKGENISFEQVLKDIQKRDDSDMTREISPLVKTKDAIEIDTTNMNINEVVNKIKELARERGLN